MPRGRHPQPDDVKEAKGNPGRRPLKSKENQIVEISSSGAAPKQLGAAARKIWDRLVPDLQHLRFIRDTDQQAFARYCQYAAEWWECVKDIKKNGSTYIVESAHGTYRRLSPSVQMRERIEKNLIALEDRFGLNPVYRQQILQRMAGMNPGVRPGELPLDSNAPPSANEPTESPIGCLTNGSSSLN